MHNAYAQEKSRDWSEGPSRRHSDARSPAFPVADRDAARPGAGRVRPSAGPGRDRQPGGPGGDGSRDRPAPDLHHHDPRGVRGGGRVLLGRTGARARPRLGRRHGAAGPRRRAARAAAAHAARSARRVRGRRPGGLPQRCRLRRRGRPGARQPPAGRADAAPLRPRLQQHDERRDPAAGAVRRGHRVPGRAGAFHLGLRRAARRATSTTSTARSSRGSSSRTWPTSWRGRGPRASTSSPTRWAPSSPWRGSSTPQMSGQLGRRGHIDHIMLASPDIDIDLFRTQIGLLPSSILERMYLLVSADDRALLMSRRIAGGVPRVGAADARELEALGLTVIDLSEIDEFELGQPFEVRGLPRGGPADRGRAQLRRPVRRGARPRPAPRRRPDPHPRRLSRC